MTEDEIVAETLTFIYKCNPGLTYTGEFLTDKYGDDFNYYAIVDRLESEGLAECRDPRHAMVITNLGRQIERTGGYLEFLKHRAEEKEAEKYKNELERNQMRAQLRELEWQHKMRWWPHVLSGIALIVSIIALLHTLLSE